jgi:ABC-2 type transport system ATP-binding protein/oleandomycin transport system ATP-binding protein
LTTQYLEEADTLADQIVVMDAGKVTACGTPDALKRRLGRQTLDVRLVDSSRMGDAATLVARAVGVDPIVDRPTGRLSAAVTDGRAMPAIVRRLDDAGIEVSELALRLPSLDDVFLALTGHRPARDPAGSPASRVRGGAS